MSTFSFRSILLRGSLYAVAIAAIMQLVFLLDVIIPETPRFIEFSFTELSEAAFLLFCTIVMLIIRYRYQVLPNLSLLLGAFFAISFVRENDKWLDLYVFDGAWQCLVTLIIVPSLIIVIRARTRFIAEFQRVSNSLWMGLFVGGFLITYVFSRLYGRSELWKAMMGEHYIRVITNSAEELTELAGYNLMVVASIELLLLARQLSSSAAESDATH